MISIEDLPEHILVDVLTRIPAEDLILNCRLVCSRWRDLVDWPVLWKRRLRRHGRDLSAWGSDLYYIFCHLEKNLLKNPCGEEGFDFWEILETKEGQWKIEDLPKADSEKFRGTDFLQRNYYVKDRPQQDIKKCFTACNGFCYKSQLITLKDHGYWDELLDGTGSTIVVKDWFYYRPGCRYRLYVGLLAADFTVLQEYRSEDLYGRDWERNGSWQWRKVTHTFYSCPRVRHIFFQHEAQQADEERGGEGGLRITHSSITLGPFSLEESDSSSESSLVSSECSCRR
nr:F-box only protein 44-like [Pogona vitticeps]